MGFVFVACEKSGRLGRLYACIGRCESARSCIEGLRVHVCQSDEHVDVSYIYILFLVL